MSNVGEVRRSSTVAEGGGLVTTLTKQYRLGVSFSESHAGLRATNSTEKLKRPQKLDKKGCNPRNPGILIRMTSIVPGQEALKTLDDTHEEEVLFRGCQVVNSGT